MGAYVGDTNRDGHFNSADERGSDLSRNESVGTGSAALRSMRKGVIFQHIANPKEWNYKGNSDGSYGSGSGLDGGRYGFRFHYNPSTIDYGMGVNEGGVNPALIMSGKASSAPITSNNMPTIRFQFFLSRIEDMMLLSPKEASANLWEKQYADAYRRWEWELSVAQKMGDTVRVRDLRSARPRRSDFKTAFQPVVPRDEEMTYFYGKTLSEETVTGIYERGTGYDLEFLFRTMLGKPWDTLLRRETADVGIAFGVPMVLDFSAGAHPGNRQHGQRYLGRVSAISYTHLSFSRRMVPMWTQVAIDFVRYPDVKNQGGTTNYTGMAGPRSPVLAENWEQSGFPASESGMSADAIDRWYSPNGN